MKRRNADCGKIRRPIKRNKITEGMYGSTTVLYLKFLILWAIVITADFMFMFRFEFLWPFWLLLRSVHDSFKYKGLAFSVLFVCIAITSDLVCLFFIPVHWLLFAASTYVWVQYVWHTDKGICLPTIILWMLFVYLEAGIRWKDSRHMPHLDLCRPFAAHCIGYPVVTLGFGFKSYVGYRMRQRKQREVAKENEFYMQLLQQALPQEENPDEVQMATANGSVLNSATLTTATVPVSQTNSLAAAVDQHSHSSHVHHHQHHQQQQQNSSVNSSSSSSHDDRTNVQITGQLGSTQQQQSAGTAGAMLTSSQVAMSGAQHQHQSNINLNCNNNTNNSNSNSSSASKNAQTANSKANNVNCSTNSSFLSTSFSSSTLGSATSNGHIPNGGASNLTTSHKNQRRSVDKDKSDSNHINSNNVNAAVNNSNNNYNKAQSNATGNSLSGNVIENFMSNSTKFTNSSYNNNQISNKDANHNSKEKDTWESGNNSHSSSNNFGKENHKSGGNSHNYEHTNGVNSGNDKKSQANGNVLQYETEDIPEPVEKKEKGRRNRSKKDTNSSSKDNHQNSSSSSSSHQLNNSNSNNSNHHHHQQHNNHHHKEKDANSETSSISSSSSTTNISNIASQVVTKICEACLRLEAEVKKYRSEVSHMKQIENELRQKLESNITTKSCLQAKQRECDELEKRIQDVTNQRQVDLMNLQNTERKLCEERRQRQSLEAQLNNEKKARKVAEEKASRQECSEACKDRKRKQEQELQQLRHQLKMTEEAKQATEQQGRKYEQELRMLEVEVRNREAQNGTEVLMNALAAMQDKNNTLEKNLSAETRVKLDLFSALGEAKRQLEIKDSKLRSKDDEVLDLKAKIAQLFAVMPNDSLCLPPCSTGSSMLRMNDTPPLQGPSSPLLGMGTAAAVAAVAASHQQMMAVAAVAHQLNSRGSSVAPPAAVSSCSTVTNVTGVPTNVGNPGVVNNTICSTGGVVPVITNPSTSIGNNSTTGGNVGVSVSQTSSNLDPNATAYTPKNSLVGGAEA